MFFIIILCCLLTVYHLRVWQMSVTSTTPPWCHWTEGQSGSDPELKSPPTSGPVHRSSLNQGGDFSWSPAPSPPPGLWILWSVVLSSVLQAYRLHQTLVESQTEDWWCPGWTGRPGCRLDPTSCRWLDWNGYKNTNNHLLIPPLNHNFNQDWPD